MSPMDDTTFQSVIGARIRDARAYCDGDLSRDRERATRFYRGDVSQVLADVDGRSKVVSRDLRDTVLAIMPSMVRIFLSNEKAVEFEPVGPEDEEAARQATDYCNYVLRNDNDGFSVLYAAMKDALVRKTGIVKVWWDDAVKMTAERFEGVDDLTFQAHQMMPDVEFADHEQTETEAGVSHAYTLKRAKRNGRVCVEAIPPEELLIARDARSFDAPSFIGHQRFMRVGDLVAMGYEFEQMLELASNGEELELNGEAAARQVDEYSGDDDESAGDPAMREVLYVEGYALIDADGDGILEMRKVCTAGDAHKVLMNEVVDDHPFAVFCPEPEPHTAIGLSLYDCLDDIQVIRSQLLRLALDSLSQAVTPRLLVDPVGQVDLKALLANRVGGVVMGRPGSVAPIPTDKAAPQAAMEAYRMMGEVRQERTGQNQASMGLEADALQSTSRIAASALVQSAQSRVEMIARIFAETGFSRMFRLILANVTRYQDRERVVRLRNKWIPMDPRSWNPDMDVTVNVGLGNGNPEERGFFLNAFLQIQQAVLEKMGPMNPLVSIDKVRNALEDLCEVGGRMPSRYLVMSDEWQQIQQSLPPPPQPKPSPEEVFAQIEAQKVRNQELEMRLKDDRERDKIEADAVIRCLEKGINPDAVLNIIRMARQATPSIVPGA